MNRSIDVRRLAKPVFKLAAPSGPQLYTETKDTIRYYSGADVEPSTRLLVAGVLMHAADYSLDTVPALSWFLSLSECFYPGLISRTLSHIQSAILLPEPLSQTDLAFLRGERNEQKLSLVPTAIYDQSYLLLASDTTLLGAYLTLLFAIGKNATEQNITAFTVNRPKAYLGRLSITAIPAALEQANMPSLLAYQTVNGAFNSYLELRRCLVTELIRWTQSPSPTPRISAAVPMIRLWETSGMTHVLLIRNLLEGYADILEKIKPLYPEIFKFMSEYELVSSSQTMGLAFHKVLEGDRRSSLFSRDYPELLKLARELASRQDSRFKLYASALGGSAYLSAFERFALDMAIPLPGGVKGPEHDFVPSQ